MKKNKYWPLTSRVNKSFKTSGSDDTGINTYTYNELGYRGDSVTKNIDILSVGCSHTEGIGVNDNETWPHYVAEALNMTHINMGFTGRSNDYISRTVTSYVRFFNPKYVFVMYTYPSRREYWTDEGPQPYASQQWGYFQDSPDKWNAFTELSSAKSDEHNFIKNHSMILMACELAKSTLVWNGSFTGYEYKDSKRFDGDYSIDHGKHATAEENKIYAKNLVGHL
jgi:hypothetical protein